MYHGYPPPQRYGRSRSPSHGAKNGKFTATFYVGIVNEEEFQVGKRIIGQGGVNMKDIVKKAGIEAKLRLRGKGSGFVEHSTGKEAEEALQLCISCTDPRGYDISLSMVDALLRRIYTDYDRWCEDKGLPQRAPDINLRERRMPDRTSGYGAGAGGAQRGDRYGKQTSKKATANAPVDRGEQPEGAPDAEEIEKLIEERNEARKDSNYSRADEIRKELQDRKVVLSDEKGAAGSAGKVTVWRYWKA